MTNFGVFMIIKLKDDRKFYNFEFDLKGSDFKLDDDLMVKIPDTLHVTGVLEKKNDTFDLKFDLSGQLEYPCSRCLEPVRIDIDNYDFDEELELEGRTEIDLDPYINDALFINEPSFIVCKEDCLGLCPVCGTNLNKETCNCSEEEDIDPRLEALKQLL